LPVEDLARLEPHLRPATLEIRRTFSEPGAPIREVCFPDSGIVSVVARVGNGRSIETGLIGFEGMTGLPILLGADRWPNETYVQMPGYGRVIDADILREALAASPTMQARFLRYAQVFTVLTGQTALANGRAVATTAFAVLLAPLVVGALADATSIKAALVVLPVVIVLAAIGLGIVQRGRRRILGA